MKQEIFHILSQTTGDTHICFKKFIEYLIYKTEHEKSFRKIFYQLSVQYCNNHPELLQPLPVSSLKQYPELMQILHGSLFAPMNDEQQTLWALSAANSDVIFYSTEAFYNLMHPENAMSMQAAATAEESVAFENNINQVKYALILERFYHIESLVNNEVIYVMTDKSTLLPKYFSVAIDNRFTEVYKVKDSPETDKADIENQLENINDLCQMESKLPLSAFVFRGFSIVTATDVTARYALHKMRSAIIRHVPGDFEHTNDQILFLLKALCGNNNLQFGLLPFLEVNNRLVSFYENYTHSIAISTARSLQINENDFAGWLNDYFRHPKIILYEKNGRKEPEDNVFFRELAATGVKGYGALPVYHNGELAGLLEFATYDELAINKSLFNRLDAALPILAQLMHNNQSEFKAGINKVIMTNFTSIQPAVQWKFNEVAWNYLRKRFENNIASDLEMIRFENVYPLYGAIDIRDSTIKRNNALYKDMQTYFSLLFQTLSSFKDKKALEILAEANGLQKDISTFVSASAETSFINHVHKTERFLHSYNETNSQVPPSVDGLVKALHKTTGIVYQHRRALETSMQTLNGLINQYIDLLQAEVQQSYPAYFEKFRTDGVEYDIYIGQSITPKQKYSDTYLYQLRLWQLRSMAAIIKLVNANKTTLVLPLETTQLIYVNASSIDINFRTDEKRFDVEGAYNIRYHIVKKRIDKVHVKTTGERLTQPDAIAIVYSQKVHGDEYKNYIAQLQQEGILQPSEEEFELEEL